MTEIHRVFVWRPGARPGSAGHALYVPADRQGAGRIDNPDLYATLYASDSTTGAVAEVFGRLPVWSPEMFRARDGVRALATYRAARVPVLDLDDPRELVARGLRPSQVATPDREMTQAWARAIFRERRWAGARWWSHLDSRWTVFGLWRFRRLRVERVERLHREHPAVRAARDAIARPWLDA